MVLRLHDDDSLLPRAGVALSVFADYVDVATGVVVDSLPMPSASGSGLAACTLGTGEGWYAWNLDTDGLPSVTADGRYVVFPCFDIPAGEPMSMRGALRAQSHALMITHVNVNT